MDRAIDFEALTPDQLEQVLGAAERRIANLRWLQVQAIRSAIRRQVPLGDGCRTAAEWIRGRVDTTPETASSLEAVADLDEAQLDRALEEGLAGFDRVAEAAKASSTDLAPHLDIAGMRRVAARRHRVTRDQEIATHRTRSVSYQRDLFGTVGHLRADGPAIDTDQIYGAIRDAADQLPRPPRPEPRAAREFDGLLALALSRGEPSEQAATPDTGDRRPLATVFVDATDAALTNGEAGAWIATGSRVGPNTLERILCDGVVELTAVTSDGTPLAAGTARSAIPPRTRRYVLARDGGCAADGCTSMTRLQPITSDREHSSATTTPTTSQLSVGFIITWSSTDAVSASTPTRRHSADASSRRTSDATIPRSRSRPSLQPSFTSTRHHWDFARFATQVTTLP